MNTMDAFLDKLRKETPGAQTVEERFEQQKREWIADLGKLMEQLGSWLSKGEAEGLIRIDRRKIELAEEDLGLYEVPALTIHLRTTHPRSIKVEPRGMRIVGVVVEGAKTAARERLTGAEGRVDLVCGAERVTLLRSRQRDWKIVDRTGCTSDFTEAAFIETLDDLIG